MIDTELSDWLVRPYTTLNGAVHTLEMAQVIRDEPRALFHFSVALNDQPVPLYTKAEVDALRMDVYPPTVTVKDLHKDVPRTAGRIWFYNLDDFYHLRKLFDLAGLDMPWFHWQCWDASQHGVSLTDRDILEDARLLDQALEAIYAAHVDRQAEAHGY